MKPHTDGTKHEQSGPSIVEPLRNLQQEKNGEPITVGELLSVYGEQSFGMVMVLFAIVIILPTGVIPMVVTVSTTVIMLLSLQLLCGFRHPWLPESIKKCALPNSLMDTVVYRYERHIEGRITREGEYLAMFLEGPLSRLSYVAMIVVALTLYPLMFIWLVEIVPAFCLLVFALGIIYRDGRFMIAGLCASGLYLIGLLYSLDYLYTLISSVF